MLVVIIAITLLVILAAVAGAIFQYTHTVVVAEDCAAVTVNKDGFIRRILPQGRHILRPAERVEFTLETKTKLASGRVSEVATADGLLIKIEWSGTYALRTQLIATDGRSQKLRNLPNASKAMARTADIFLRRLVGNHPVRDLFDPTVREQLERRLSHLMIDRLKPLGIAFNGIDLQTIELPPEVAEALNKAKAIETLDGTIRQLDPTTREVVRGAYQLDEILHWDAYLPIPSRATMKRLSTPANR